MVCFRELFAKCSKIFRRHLHPQLQFFRSSHRQTSPNCDSIKYSSSSMSKKENNFPILLLVLTNQSKYSFCSKSLLISESMAQLKSFARCSSLSHNQNSCWSQFNCLHVPFEITPQNSNNSIGLSEKPVTSYFPVSSPTAPTHLSSKDPPSLQMVLLPAVSKHIRPQMGSIFCF